MVKLSDMQSDPKQVIFWIVFGAIITLWFANVVLFALYIDEPLASILAFTPGILGVGILLKYELSPEECYFKIRPISYKGLVVYIAMLTLMIPVVYTGFRTRTTGGLDWIQALVYAPVSGIPQELFFRSTLFPLLIRGLGGRVWPAMVIDSVLFALYHVGMFFVAPQWAAVSALIITFIAGLGWTWQVQHDRTVYWAMLHHSCLQIILRLFVWT